MKKVCVKIFSILLVVMLLISVINVGVEASTADTIKSTFSGGTDGPGREPATKILSAVLSVVRTVGAAVAIVVLMTIGAKYIIASAGDRADIKKYAMNYVIGAIILLGASGILSVVKSFVDQALQ